MLAEVFRNASPQRICQVELGDNYDHKHQELSAHDPTRGPAPHGGRHRHVADPQPGERRRAVRRRLPQDAWSAYLREAQDTIAAYADDRASTGCGSTATKRSSWSRLLPGLRAAGFSFVHDPMGAPQIPNWNRLSAAILGLLPILGT